MSHNIKTKGFTLIELIVSVTILAAIGTVLVQGLYTILIVRSKQQSIETSASSTRQVFTTITNAIETASSSPTISSNILKITGNPCRTIASISGSLKQSIDASPSCAPPVSATDLFTPQRVNITKFAVVSNASGLYSATLSGTYKDQFGSHDFNYQTSVIPRISL